MNRKPNTGVLFRNDKKKSDNSPDYTGKIYIDPSMAGKEVSLAAWISAYKTDDSKKYLQLRVREMQATNSASPGNQKTSEDRPFNDDIPF